MKNTLIFKLGLMFALSGIAFTQTKTITNADLEKFKQRRLKAEKELKENYREMGFPSPEELDRQNEKSLRELTELSDRLRERRIAREYRETEGSYSEDYYRIQPSGQGFIEYQRYYSPNFYYRGNGTRYRNRFPNRRTYKRRDFRQRFIDGLPGFVLRNHRFNRINTNRGVRKNRRGVRNGRRNRR